MDKVVSYSIAGAIVLAGAGVFYNFAIVQPALERERLEAEQAARDSADAEKKAAALALEAKDAQRKNDYKACQQRVREIMRLAQADQCSFIASNQETDRRKCIERGGDPSLCTQKFPPLDASPFCTLPSSVLASNEKFERENQDRCLDEAKAGL